jgi:Holliday junction resolvasome RuvABC DNA-binding subunit
MGFRRKEIEPVVEEITKSRKGEGFETMLRDCLKALSRV